MRVVMYYNNRDVRLEEMPTPNIRSGELLVRIETKCFGTSQTRKGDC